MNKALWEAKDKVREIINDGWASDKVEIDLLDVEIKLYDAMSAELPVMLLRDKETGEILKRDHPIYKDTAIKANGDVYAVINDTKTGELTVLDLRDKYEVIGAK